MSRPDIETWQQTTGGARAWRKAAPEWLVDVMEAASHWVGINWRRSSQERWNNDERRSWHSVVGAEAWGSEVEPAKEAFTITGDASGVSRTFGPYEAVHVIALDIDHEAALIPSSTPGHYHLVIDHRLTWSDYKDLLDTMAEVGVIQAGFRDASVERGQTFLRMPWVRKGMESYDAQAALHEWLDADRRPENLQGPEAVEAFLKAPHPPSPS